MKNRTYIYLILGLSLPFFAGTTRAQTFTELPISLAYTEDAIESGDYDNDGDLDIILMGKTINEILLYKNENGSFIDEHLDIAELSDGDFSFGDYDNDGDLDIAMIGSESSGVSISYVFKNEDGTFIDTGVSLYGLRWGSIDWGDYDNDGDLDLLMTGRDNAGVEVSVIYKNDKGDFIDIRAGLQGIEYGEALWGDYDNDGDLDVVLSGEYTEDDIAQINVAVTQLYENRAGIFVENNQSTLLGVSHGSLDWGDFDNDGDLDLLMSGQDMQDSVYTKIYQNNQGVFLETSSGIPGVYNGDLEWADIDNDGDLDILSMGTCIGSSCQGAYPVDSYTRVFENAGGTFRNVNAGLEPRTSGHLDLGDYDRDGDLDFLMSGEILTDNMSFSGFAGIVYRNNTPLPNTPPEAPVQLNHTVDKTNLSLTWDAVLDAETPSVGLSYNLRMGFTPQGVDLVSPMAFPNGLRKITRKGNMQQNTEWDMNLTPKDLSPAPYLFWNVQAIDHSFAGSNFSVADTVFLAGKLNAIADVPNDEGGQVLLNWRASDFDNDPGFFTHYSVWRAIPEGSGKSAHTHTDVTEIGFGFEGPAYRSTTTDNQQIEWELVDTVPAEMTPSYDFIAPTLYDSSSVSRGLHLFMITAHTSNVQAFFDGIPRLGYSVDNTAPAPPQNLAISQDANGVSLSWEASTASDVAQYLIFRSTAPGIDTNTGIFITTENTSFLDNTSLPSGPLYYLVIAEDINGNRSAATPEVSIAVATGIEGISSEIPADYDLHQNYPNPFNPSTLLRFDMPEAGPATVVVYNTFGQQVEVLVNGSLAAGRHEVTWQPDNLSSGVYYYRFEAGGFSATRQLVFVK